MNIKMFQMGFGESILLYDDNSCILVDCGSESSKKKEYFNTVKSELEQFNNKSLLITHFHSDHTNGIKYLGKQRLADFDRIYLPHIFAFEDKTLELLIAEYLLEALMDRRRKSPQIWGSLISVTKAKRPIVLISQGKHFNAAGHSFRALWPPPENPETENEWSNLKKSLSKYRTMVRKAVTLISPDIINLTNFILAMAKQHGQKKAEEKLAINISQIHGRTPLFAIIRNVTDASLLMIRVSTLLAAPIVR